MRPGAKKPGKVRVVSRTGRYFLLSPIALHVRGYFQGFKGKLLKIVFRYM